MSYVARDASPPSRRIGRLLCYCGKPIDAVMECEFGPGEYGIVPRKAMRNSFQNRYAHSFAPGRGISRDERAYQWSCRKCMATPLVKVTRFLEACEVAFSEGRDPTFGVDL